MRSYFLAAVAVAASIPLFGAGELSGRRAPGFSLPDSTMRQYDLQDYRGKPVLIDIMQTNCPHCRVFSGILEKVKAKYAGRIVILSIVNPPDTLATVSQFVQQSKITVPVLFDCGQVAASYLKVTPQNPSVSVPHVFLIDAAGMIRNDFGYGPANTRIFEGDGLFGEVEKLLGPAPAPKTGRK